MKNSDQTTHERISALLDDELDSVEQEEILSVISDDTRLAETWQRYYLIRAAVRREAIVHVPGLPARMESVLSPGVTQVRHRRPRQPSTGRWLPGLALAASIAGLVSLGLFGFLPGTEIRESGNPAVVAEVDQGNRWNATSPDVEHTLNTFLVEHGEFTPMPNMNGMMAYARFVSYDSDY